MSTAIYLRQSLDRNGNELTVSRQRQECRNLVSRQNLVRKHGGITEYIDNDTSATNGRRPEYAQMLADIESGAVNAVVCYHLDRLHRQPRELEQFITLADKHHLQLATVTGEVDLSTAQGRLIARIMGAVARNEVEHKSARQKAANRQRANGGKAWVQRTFGYDGNDVVESEAELIRQGCAALLNGQSLWGIAREWNSLGVETVKGCGWNGGTVKQVLSRARNAGLQTYDGEILEGVETGWPAIVSRDTYDAVKALLADPKRHTGKRRARVHLLSGLAYCGACGRKMGTAMRPTKKGAKRVVYQCKNMGCAKVVRDLTKTDAHVIKVVCARLARPDAAEIFAKPTVDTKALNAEANTYRELIKAAETEYDEGIIDGRRLQGRIDALMPKLQAVEAKLLGANTERKLNGLVGNPKAREAFEDLALDRQRAVIDTCCRVTIEPNEQLGGAFDPQRVRIDWR